jgi:hypothetical protein
LILDDALLFVVGQDLAHEIRPASNAKFFRQHAQGGVRCDEVHGLNARIALDGDQQLPEKHGSAGARGRDGQILWRMIRQRFSGEAK